MFCSVYKTPKKQGMFLYVPVANDFADVPAALMEKFPNPQLVMHIPEKTNKSLHIDKAVLSAAFEHDGFYLQMPPKQENWLAEHRQELGLSPQPPREIK
ncbi:YcgL domain-containing protein [Alteromonas sp. SM 2104]|nr:YcgL domain-containing protein [Alteromonas oceanisediminis]